LTFQLTRELKHVDEVNQFPAKISQLLAEGRDTTEVQQAFFETRQALEWILKQVRPPVTLEA
jgi:predicted peptidase